MKKDDFLEILKDYLQPYFTSNEVDDILRDYEEYFINGAIEGKTEAQLVDSLGSPKSIVEELIKTENKVSLNKSKVKVFLDNFKQSMKINLQSKNHVESRKKVRLMVLLSAIVATPIGIAAIAITIGILFALLGSVFIGIVAVPFANSFISVMPYMKALTLFMVVAYLGFEILAWQFFVIAVKYEIKVAKDFIAWMKTNRLYINGSIKKEKKDLEVEGEDDSE